MLHKNLAAQDSHTPSQEQVENHTGSPIAALKCVKYTGIGTLYPSIALSNANDDVRGITYAEIQNNAKGYILAYGLIYNLDTSVWAPGTSLFSDASGNLTDVSGGGPQVANVLKQHATLGVLQVTCLDTPAAMSVLVQDTDSIDLDTLGSLLTADLRLSANAASLNNLKATTTIQSVSSKGLHIEYPFANGSTDGVLRATDWTTFNNKVEQTDARLSVMNVLKVKKNPGTGEFLTIAAAIATANAGSPSATNRYVIHVAPGIYSESLLTVPPYVYVVGYSMGGIVVEPDAGNHNVFNISENSGLAFLTIQNAGAGFAGILAEDTGENCIIHKVDVMNCDYGLIARTTLAATGTHYCYLEYISFENCNTRAILTETLGSGELKFRAENLYIFAEGTETPIGIEANGDVDIGLSSGTMERIDSPFGDAIQLNTTSEIDVSSIHIDNWINGFQLNDNCIAKINSATFENNLTNIEVADVGVSGFFNGYSEYLKININTNSSFFITHKDANLITVAKKGGDFSSIKDAIDNISGASSSNPYLVKVGPGIFLEDQITMKAFIVVEGADDGITIIQANDPTQPFIIGSSNSELRHLQVCGPTDAGVPLIYFTATAASGTFTTIDCAFNNADRIYEIVNHATFPTVFRSEGCRITSSADLINSILRVDGTNAGPMLAYVNDFIYRRMVAAYANHLFEVVGSNARLLVKSSLFETNSNVTHGLHVENGARVGLFSVLFQGFDTAVHSHNVGSGSYIEASNLVIRECNTDINLEHPGTTGAISAVANSSKITVDPSSTATITLTSNLLDGGMLASGPLKIGRKFSYAENVLDLLEGEPSMGVMNGGELTDGGGFDVDVNAGFGYAMVSNFPDHRIRRIEWSNTSITLGSNQDVYIYFNNSGVLTSSSSVSNTAFVVLLGRVVTNGTGIELIDTSPLHTHHPMNHMDQLFRDALGPIYDSGSIVTENVTPFKIDITGGIYFFSVNRFTPVGGTAKTFTQYYQNGLGGWNRSSTDTVNNTNYDDNSGTLAPLTAGYYTKHTLYVNCDGAAEKYFLVLGQAEYAALAAVEDAPLPSIPSWLHDAVSPIASIVIQEGASNIIGILDIRPRIGFTSSGVSASADHGNLLGLLDDDHPQYLLVDGSRPMGNDLDMGTNDINNVGLVDGVDVSAHASRHLPNGADPLSTAAPITAVGGNTSNAVGIANSLSRSDHQHAIATGTPSTINPDQANAAGSSNNLARADHIHNIPADVAVGLDANSTNTEGVGSSFARNDHTHDLSTGTVTSQAPDQANAEGSSVNLARADHIHNIPTAAPVTANADGSNNQGVAATFSRADHKHNVATAIPVTQNPDQANAAGVSSSLARADHVHNIPTDVPTTTLSPSTTNAEGVGTSFARNDHTHAIATGVIGDITTIQPDDSASAGTADRFARGDHRHAIMTDAPTTNLSPVTTNAEGAATSFARSNHTHAIETAIVGDITTIQPDDSAAAGTIDRFARGDHRHAIVAAAATSISTSSSNAEGASTSFSRADHTHAVSITNSGATATADTTTTSATYVLINAMTLTPAAGTYLVMFSTSLESSTDDASIFVSIYSGGSQITHTEREAVPNIGGGFGSNPFVLPVATQCIVTVNGSQAIEARWRRTAGTATAHERTLTILKVA